ncbi:MAG: energy-coupling factor transporter transmembrane component T family protein [Rectinemataceae bacterium]
MAGLEVFRFEWGDGFLHRLHPLSKLVVLLIVSWATLALGPGLLSILFVLALALLALVRAKPGELLRNARFLFPLYLFVAFMRVVQPDSPTLFHFGEFLPASVYMARLALVFLFAETFFRSTSIVELADAITRCARRLPGLSGRDPGFYLSLTLGFIPRCIDAYGRSREAAFARALGARRNRGMKASTLSALFVLESFVAAALCSALRSATALEARSYNPGRSIARRPLRFLDLAIPLGFAAAALAWLWSGY